MRLSGATTKKDTRATAAGRDLVVLHDDNDFATAARHLTELRERPVHRIPGHPPTGE